MSAELPLRCTCGRVRGVALDLSPASVNRVVCYCDDCQAFARFLERADVLDAAGGTDVVQLAPAQVRIDEGADALRCVRLSPKGLHRWYTDCCRTPVGNTSPRFPFVGLIHSFIDPAAACDELVGPPIGVVHDRFATGAIPPLPHRVSMPTLILRVVKNMGSWWISGKGSPSPFFDARTRAPRSAPQVLRVEQRDALRPRRA
jgi:hypothetical protein